MEQHKSGHDETMEMPKIDMKDVDFNGAFKQFLEVVKLNKKAIESVASNAKGGAVAAIFLVVGSIAAPLASFIFGYKFLNVVYRPDIVTVLIQAVIAIAIAALVIFITSVVANKLFKGKGSFADYFRVMGLAYGLNVLNFLGPVIPSLSPLLSLVVGIWVLVISFYAIQSVFKLDNTNAVLTIIVTIVAFFVLGAVAGAVGFGAAYNSVDLSGLSITY